MRKKTQSPRVKLNQRKRASLQQASVIFSLGIALVILLALFTFTPSDPGPFHNVVLAEGEKCGNLAGCKGAWLASLVFGLVGYLAYAIPIGLFAFGMAVFKRPVNAPNPNGGVNTAITVIGGLFVFLAGAGLAHMLFDPYPAGIGGGLLGSGIAGALEESVIGFVGTLLLLLSLFFMGITLVTDISWLDVADKVGDWVFELVDKVQQKQAKQKEVTAADISNQTSMNYEQGNNSLLGKGQSLLDKAQKGLGAVATGVTQRLSSSLQRKTASADGNPYLEGNQYENDDPLFMEPRQRDYEVRNSTERMKAQPVKPLNEGNNGANLKIPDVDFLQGVAHESNPVPVAAAPVPQQETPKKKKIPKAPQAESSATLVLPKLNFLNVPPPAKQRITQTKESLSQLGQQLVISLGHYGLNGVEVVESDPGPVITRFELKLPDGTKASRVSGLANDLARNLCVSSVRVVEVIPGRPTIGIEIPNEKRDVVTIREMMDSEAFKKSRSPLTLALGKDISGNPVVADLQRMPHLLVAGTTGSGKSVAVNTMLVSILYKATPDNVRLILIDPKMLELSSYEGIPHLLTPVVTDMKEASNALRWCVAEMERRYLLMSKLKVRNITGFNNKILEARERGEEIPDPLFDPQKSMETQPSALEPLPFIVVVVDEFADMMMVVGKKVEELIARLAQKARASGIHLILATQRPSVDVITGLIKANIPTRIAFQVSTKIDSRTILDQGGAEQLLGYGDMLYMPPGVSMPNRVHGALVTDQEVEDVATFLKQQMEPDYIEGVLAEGAGGDGIPGLENEQDSETDPLYDEAVAIVTESRRASISYLQRRLKVGYNRAARMIEDMEAAGVVSAVQGNGTREVLAPPPVQG